MYGTFEAKGWIAFLCSRFLSFFERRRKGSGCTYMKLSPILPPSLLKSYASAQT